MKRRTFTKRDLLKIGSAVAAGSITQSRPIAAQVLRLGGKSEKMIFAQGALGGGGYVKDIDISPDGTTRVVSTDVANGWVWDVTTSKWQNVLNYSKVPAAYRAWGRARNCWAIKCAPSLPTRVYMVTPTGPYPAPVWRSDDRCKTWSDTGYTVAATTEWSRGIGPLMAVDPNNPDVVYIADAVGIIHRSFDGGNTWQIVHTLTSALLSARTIAPTVKKDNVLHFSSVPPSVLKRGKYPVYAYDVTNPKAITSALRVNGGNSTSVRLSGHRQGAIARGDTILFGSFASIVFDPTSGTTRGKTNGIYIGFGYGASGVYYSTDAGSTFSSMSGSPTLICRLHCSKDGVVYATDQTGWGGGGGGTGKGNPRNAWKYQSGRWTNFRKTSSPGNTYHGVASDPNNPGTVVFIQRAGNICMSTNYGSSFSANGHVNPRVAKDAPWLATTFEHWQSNGAIAFDPVISGRLWIVEGIGIWYCTPTVASPTSTIYSQTIDNNELILTALQKPPGGPLLTTCWDRGGFVIPSPTTYPSHDFCGQFVGHFGHGWDIDYAKDDTSFFATILASTVYSTADAGKTWRKLPQAAGTNWGGSIAVQTSKNFVVFPSNNGVPSYTKDGGSTWSACLFNGYPMQYGWSFAYYLNRHILCADFENKSTYYALSYGYQKGIYSILTISGGRGYKIGDTITFAGNVKRSMAAVVQVTSVSGSAVTGVKVLLPGVYGKPLPHPISQVATSGTGSGATFTAIWSALGGSWRSTDGGANWTQMSRANPNGNNANGNSKLVAVPGHEGHLFFGCGGQNRFPLARSIDGGASWHFVNGPYGKCVGYQVACGKSAPGKSYPAIYMIGNLPGKSILDKPMGLYRCDDFTSDPKVLPTWKLLSHSPCDLLDYSNCLCADPDTFGTIYIAFGGTGYGYGKLAN
jgi:hypothetical protein